MIYYIVYKLTNTVNGKIYVGCHMTKDVNDGYMGSGRRLGYAKKKYGEAAFKKEILKVCETADEMLAEEAKIVDEEFLKRPDVYNLTCGGRGSWFWINATLTYAQRSAISKVANEGQIRKLRTDPQAFDQLSKRSSATMKKTHASGKIRHDTFRGRRHTEQTLQKMRLKKEGHGVGQTNSQFGTCWIFHQEHGIRKCKMIELDQLLKDGWTKGRRTFSV